MINIGGSNNNTNIILESNNTIIKKNNTIVNSLEKTNPNEEEVIIDPERATVVVPPYNDELYVLTQYGVDRWKSFNNNDYISKGSPEVGYSATMDFFEYGGLGGYNSWLILIFFALENNTTSKPLIVPKNVDPTGENNSIWLTNATTIISQILNREYNPKPIPSKLKNTPRILYAKDFRMTHAFEQFKDGDNPDSIWNHLVNDGNIIIDFENKAYGDVANLITLDAFENYELSFIFKYKKENHFLHKISLAAVGEEFEKTNTYPNGTSIPNSGIMLNMQTAPIGFGRTSSAPKIQIQMWGAGAGEVWVPNTGNYFMEQGTLTDALNQDNYDEPIKFIVKSSNKGLEININGVQQTFRELANEDGLKGLTVIPLEEYLTSGCIGFELENSSYNVKNIEIKSIS